MNNNKIHKVSHEVPGEFRNDYILLPYGEFYLKTKYVLDARPGDTLRFFNGPDVVVLRSFLVSDLNVIDFLCRMRYGIPWEFAFKKWLSYARLEGNGRDILSKDKCIVVSYEKIKL